MSSSKGGTKAQGRSHHQYNTGQRKHLQAVAQETCDVVPDLLEELDRTNDAQTAWKFTLDSTQSLDPNLCPSYPAPATINVVNQDTLDTAIEQLRRVAAETPVDARLQNPFPLVVNFASRKNPGGGWLNGSLAQEEALCYRSSLATSLDKSHYPLATNAVLYIPYVLVLRHGMASGHSLMVPETAIEDLPTVSVVTVAAINKPQIRGRVFAREDDRNVTKEKMRLTLRIAATHGHRMLVLGALGCGVFANPPEDVAYCWREVLWEKEFAGNWWKEVCFAVYDQRNEGNYEIFRRVLQGQKV